MDSHLLTKHFPEDLNSLNSVLEPVPPGHTMPSAKGLPRRAGELDSFSGVTGIQRGEF